MPNSTYTLPNAQRGAALAVGLLFLLVLTILGVSSLSTTSLEEKMAGNMQEKTRAFQSAEAGAVRLLNTIELSTADDCSQFENITNLPLHTSDISACTEYLGTTDAGRTTDTAFSNDTNFVHFNIYSESTTVGNARAVVNQGVYQLGPGSTGLLVQ